MDSRTPVTPTWEGEADRLRRMAEANRRAWIAWLDSLSIESSIRAFEDLCECHPEVAADRLPKPEPVVLGRIWRSA